MCRNDCQLIFWNKNCDLPIRFGTPAWRMKIVVKLCRIPAKIVCFNSVNSEIIGYKFTKFVHYILHTVMCIYGVMCTWQVWWDSWQERGRHQVLSRSSRHASQSLPAASADGRGIQVVLLCIPWPYWVGGRYPAEQTTAIIVLLSVDLMCGTVFLMNWDQLTSL